MIANSSLWPIWALISFAGAIFPFLLCPVYINFISRMQLAWSLDRQLPEWFGEVNERLRAPLNAILATLGLTALFLFFQSYNALPHFLATTGNKLNLAGTAWFSITMAVLTWTMPGVNAILVRCAAAGPRAKRPVREGAAVGRAGWLVFPVWVYAFGIDQADLGQPHGDRRVEADLPRDERHPRRAASSTGSGSSSTS